MIDNDICIDTKFSIEINVMLQIIANQTIFAASSFTERQFSAKYFVYD